MSVVRILRDGCRHVVVVVWFLCCLAARKESAKPSVIFTIDVSGFPRESVKSVKKVEMEVLTISPILLSIIHLLLLPPDRF
jgi:hypothetical protein